jgi:dihydropyrimidinase
VRIYGGLTVTGRSAKVADVVVQRGRITSVEPASTGGDIDARGCLVLPGGVDPHTHPLSDLRAASTWGARGGTTTLLAFTSPQTGESPTHAYLRAENDALPNTVVSAHLHPVVARPETFGKQELEALRRQGARSLKLFLAYPELGMAVSDVTLYETLRAAAEVGILVMVHCESPGLIEARTRELIAAGSVDARAFVDSRPPVAEVEGVARTLYFARLAEAPVYLVHLTTEESLDLVRAARHRGQTVYAEACTHHLILDDSVYDRDDAKRFLVVPPLRPRPDVEALWEGILDGTIDTVGSDHVQAAHVPPESTGDFRSLPYGFAGVEVRLPLVLSEGLKRQIPLPRLAEVLATRPAKVFELHASKGAIRAGGDADIVIWDPEPVNVLQREELHGGLEMSPFHGIEVRGNLRTVFHRGSRVSGARPTESTIAKATAKPQIVP